MDFSFPILDGGDLNVQGNWLTVNPAKTVPMRAQEIDQGSQSAGVKFLNAMGFPSVQGNSAVSDVRLNLDCWEAALAGQRRNSGHNITEQILSNGTAAWNNIRCSDLLALAEAASSEASTSGNQRESNRGMPRHFFPFQLENSQQESNSGFPLLLNQNYYSIQENSNSPNILLPSQNYSVISNQRSNSNYQPQQIPQGEFPVRQHPQYDLNSPPRTIAADAVSNGSISFQFEPATPDKGRNEQNSRSEILNSFIDERSEQARNMLQDGNNSIGNNMVQLHCQESQLQSTPLPTAPEHPSQPAVEFLAPPSTQLKQANNAEKGMENGFDLNRTPQQKPRRKKIRPRVVREGKPKTPPKSTAKEANKTGDKPAKRKYVRKNGTGAQNTPNTPNTPPGNAAGKKISDQNASTANKSCKRSLNFNLEGQEQRNVSHQTTVSHLEEQPPSHTDGMSSMFAFDTFSKSQAEPPARSKAVSGNKSTFQLAKGLEVVVNNSSAGTAFDLNRSITQMLEYISLPEKQDPSIAPPERDDRLKEKNVLDGKIDDASTGGETHNRSDVPETTSQYISPAESVRTNESATSSISKRGRADSYTHEEASHQSLNLIGGNLNMSLPFPEIHKKRRTEKIQKAARANKSSSMAMLGDTSTEPRTSQSYNSSLGLQYSNACGAENVRNSGSSDLHESFSQTKVHYMQSTPPDGFPRKQASNGIARDRQAAASHYRALATYPASLTIPMHYMPSIPVYQHSRKEASSAATQYKMQAAGNYLHGYCSPSQATTSMQHMHSIPVGMPPRKETPNGATYYKVQASDVMLTLSQTERITKKRSKAPTRVRDFASLTSTSAGNSLPSTQTKSYLENYKGSDNGTSIRTLLSHSTSTNGVKLQDNQLMVYNYQKSLPKPKGPRGRPRRVDSPIDELTRKLNSLNINSEHNALVPYTGHGQILPYEGLFDPTKKRKPRAKVDLDLESERVWKLLMGLESDSGAEGTDADKEKWWEEERRVFHGRADSFIARMHLIQGDRRFTKWTGSVVDSVVGVFLTQNVSDHLSSSAFMAMAAHFPLKSTNNDSACNRGHMYVEEPEACIVNSDRDKTREPICNTELTTSNTPEYMENGEMCNSNDSFGSNEGAGRSADIRNCVALFTDESRHDICDESLKNIATGISGTKHASLPEDVDRGSLEPQSSVVSSQNSVDSAIHTTVRTSCIENDRPLESDERGTLEDLVSSQNSVNSFIAHTDEVARSCSDSNSEEDLTTGCKSKSINTSFMELLQRVDTSMMQECNSNGSGCLSSGFHSEIFCEQAEKRSDNGELNMPNIDGQRNSFSIHLSNSELEPSQNPITHSTKHSLHVKSQPRVLEVQCSHVIGAENRFDSPSNVQTLKDINNTSGIGTVTETVSETTVQQNMAYSCSNQEGRNKILNPESAPSTSPPIIDDAMTKVNNNVEQQVKSSLSNHPLAEAFNVVESVFQVDQQKHREEKVAESSMKEQVYSSERVSATTTTNSGKGKRKAAREKKQEFDWDSLRKEALHRCGKRERSHETVDSLDWESVRNADVGEIAETIKERGMNNMLAARIKAFLNRLVKDHGSIDLEWLRDVPPDKAKEYLLSIRGLGLKSVECVRLLTLHNLAFPVDTNVGRIAVRLGWVPLQPLPESLQLHLLELYPIQETIQKYLWPRLCKLDQRTLYELHYQLITFGKVFCTKSKPNCNACPMRAECKHFASAFASARLALPGPEEKGIVSSTTPVEANQSQPVHVNQMSLPPPETNTNLNPSPHITPMPHLPSETNMLSESSSKINSDPIIEMPASPERECTEVLESDIEDAFGEDPDEIPMIKLNIKEFTTNLQNYMQENNMDIQEVDVSKALVALTPEAASIPTPKLKNVSRLRTEHQVYELPDSHPLLNEVEKRIDGDSGSYLLAIWTPGETPESTQPPGRCHSFQTSGSLCNEKTCFSCNSVREVNSQTVRGTLLIPCKTAMRGSFPLNGTYFQVNEVFADHASSLAPIDVPRKWLWNLERRTVLFGTSIPTIFKGQTTAEIQNCFWRGYVCVRGFDRKTRAPKPLMARLHFPASKLAKTKETKQEMKGKQV